MAKFAKWKGFIDLSRDLTRGLYKLTFAENMPGEPVHKSWIPAVISPPTCNFALFPLEESENVKRVYYYLIGTRCYFYLESGLLVQGDAQSTFWIRLPVPSKYFVNFRNRGFYYDLTTNRHLFIDTLVGYPSYWWIRLVCHSETANLGAWPRGNGQLYIEGSYEVHPTWIKTGEFPELSVTFDASPGSNFQSFTSGLVQDAGDMTINNQSFKYMSLGDWVIVLFDFEIEIGITPPSVVSFTLPRETSDFGFVDNKIVMVGDWDSVINAYSGESYVRYDRSASTADIIIGSDVDPEEYQPGETYNIRGIWQYPAAP